VTLGFEHTLGVMAAALAVDAVIGDPDALWRRVPHPAALMGKLIGAFDRVLNSGDVRRLKGVLAVLVLVSICGSIGVALAEFGGWIVEAVISAILIAQNSLWRHFEAVRAPLAGGDLGGARSALAMIVGRDVRALDESGVARAGIESLAESTSDGIVAPVFWGALFGLPGILIYKAVNTADSMIGHRDARYAEFGWAAARLDDLLNLAPARITGLLFMAAARSRAAFDVMMRDARKHASPNAGFPEAAMAGALGVRLGGPRAYEGEVHDLPWFGDGPTEANAEDMIRARRIYVTAMVIHGAVILALWLLLQ